jgi:hypothetical protein
MTHSLRRSKGSRRESLSVSGLLAGIAYRHPSLMKRAHIHVIANVRAYIRIAGRDVIHELLANQFSSVARNYVEEAYQIERVFPMDN